MKNELTAKRLSIALSNANLSQQDLSEASGVNKASISQYVNGSHVPSNISSNKMSKVLNVNPLWLMGFDVDQHLSDNLKTVPIDAGVIIPVLGRVAAGYGHEAIEEKIDEIEISPKTAAKGEHFGLVIVGDSMEPSIHEKDIVIVNRDCEPESGDLVIAMVNGHDATCKRLMIYADGIALIPNNPTYEPLRFTKKEVEETPVRILGKVVELRRKF
ncbi:MAG: XRE family transcriptional regulator [Lachnospiraceae bacterium]|nr:XRE family transcriptional regulator [Lachnospiraceae bacterium]